LIWFLANYEAANLEQARSMNVWDVVYGVERLLKYHAG
jgi:hypothetical protein